MQPFRQVILTLGIDRNTLIGMLLIGVIFIAFGDRLFPTPPAAIEREAQEHVEDSLRNTNSSVHELIPPSAKSSSLKPDSSSNSIQNQAVFKEEILILENEVLELQLSTSGGRLVAARLKNYMRYDSTDLWLFESSDARLAHLYQLSGTEYSPKNMDFRVVDYNKSSNGSKSASITLRNSFSADKYIDHIYTLDSGTYNLKHKVFIKSLSDKIGSNGKLILDWRMTTPRQEKGIDDERLYGEVYYQTTEGDIDYESRTGEAGTVVEESLKWISLKQKFFSAIVNSETPMTDVEVGDWEYHDDSKVKNQYFTASLDLTGGDFVQKDFDIFLGPNQYHLLKSFDQKYERLLPWGWGIFRWVNAWFIAPIFYGLAGWNLHYGLIILLLTVFVKIILLPFLYKSYRSNAKMKVLKPQTDELKEKFKDDPKKQQAEQLKLWQQTGVNPLGGCLPMLFQMPILFAVFRFFPASIELRQQSFLWADDLSTYDAFINLPFEIPFYGAHVSLFTLLMTVSTFLQMKFNNQMSAAGNDQMKQMKYIMYFMPVMFMFVLNRFSSGLTYYYFISNIITFVQQFLIKRTINEEKIMAKIEEKKKKNKNKKSGFQKRLEDLSKQRKQR